MDKYDPERSAGKMTWEQQEESKRQTEINFENYTKRLQQEEMLQGLAAAMEN